MLLKFADWLIYDICGMSPESHLAGSIHFFIYDDFSQSVHTFQLLLFKEEIARDVVRVWKPRGKIAFAHFTASGSSRLFFLLSSLPGLI